MLLLFLIKFIAVDVNLAAKLRCAYRRLVSSVGRAPDCSAGGRGFEPQTGLTVRVLKKLRRTCCLCNCICKWLDVQVFSDKDYKP